MLSFKTILCFIFSWLVFTHKQVRWLILKNVKCHPVHDFMLILLPISQYCWSLSLGNSYTVFEECRLKFDMAGQKPQRITHNQSPKEFPWTQLLTRKQCTKGEGRRAAESPDWNRMDCAAGDCLKIDTQHFGLCWFWPNVKLVINLLENMVPGFCL